MNEMGLKCLVRIRNIVLIKATKEKLLKHITTQFKKEKMNQKWVTDVTEFHILERIAIFRKYSICAMVKSLRIWL